MLLAFNSKIVIYEGVWNILQQKQISYPSPSHDTYGSPVNLSSQIFEKKFTPIFNIQWF